MATQHSESRERTGTARRALPLPDLERRVYASEFKRIGGWGNTWFYTLRKRGLISPGRRDPGGIRLWWTISEVRETLERLGGTTATDAPAVPAPAKVETRAA